MDIASFSSKENNSFSLQDKKLLKKYPYLLKLPKDQIKKWVDVYKTLPSDTSGHHWKEFSVDPDKLDGVATKRAFTLRHGKRPEKTQRE